MIQWTTAATTVMTNATLTIRDHHFDTAALATSAALPNASANEQAALDFCCEWLSPAQSFMVDTSGSTGVPKSIALSRTQMCASVHATAAALELLSGMRSLVCLPVHAIAGRMMLVRGLELGLAMTLVEPAANPLAALPADAAIDFAAFVPLQLETLLAGPERARVDAMHAVLVGGGPINRALAEAIAPLHAPIYHTYGMTETATHVALRRLSGPAGSNTFIPLPGVALRLDARGSLAIQGPMTEGGWVQTNDLVNLHNDGSFVWLGRLDNVVNTGGIKVHIEPLEAVLETLLPELLGGAWDGRRFAIAAQPDARLGQMVVLLLEGASWPDDVQGTLLRALRERLGPYEAPRVLHYADRFAETSTGKIDRAATLARATSA